MSNGDALDLNTIMNWENEDQENKKKKLSTDELFDSEEGKEEKIPIDKMVENSEGEQSQDSNSEKTEEKTESDNNSQESSQKESVTSFIKRNKDKLTGELIDPKFLESDRYLVFKIKDSEGNVSIFCHQPCDLLYLYPFEPRSISITSSGIIIKSDNIRTYVGKTLVKQYYLDNYGLPNKYITIKKNVKSEDSEEVSNSLPNTETLKLYISRSANKLYKPCSEVTDFQTLVSTCLKEMENIEDINYLIKIEEEVFLDSRRKKE